jgi:hypothetical protein
MSTSLVSNGDRGVWINDGVGEVWLAALSERIREQPDSSPELLALSRKIEQGLAARWIVGALGYDFGSLLKKPELSAIMRSFHEQIADDWRAQAASGPLIVHGKWRTEPDYALPELEMLGRLFFDPASVPMPPHIHLPGKGWTIA